MSDLRVIEKQQLEKILGMSTGYVLDFNDRTFQEFIQESIGINIDNKKYYKAGTSKANRLRTFWEIESNQITSNLIISFLEYIQNKKTINGHKDELTKLEIECYIIADNLRDQVDIPTFPPISDTLEKRTIELLIENIRISIINGQPEASLDRLHTLVFKYLRNILNETKEDRNATPMHSLLGKYIKTLKEEEFDISSMSETILKTSISILDKFNSVRNNKSLAHDNRILDQNESIYIFNSINNLLKFIEAVENNRRNKST